MTPEDTYMIADSRNIMMLVNNYNTMTWTHFRTAIYYSFYWDNTVDGNHYWRAIHSSQDRSAIDIDDVRQRLMRIAVRADMGLQRGL